MTSTVLYDESKREKNFMITVPADSRLLKCDGCWVAEGAWLPYRCTGCGRAFCGACCGDLEHGEKAAVMIAEIGMFHTRSSECTPADGTNCQDIFELQGTPCHTCNQHALDRAQKFIDSERRDFSTCRFCTYVRAYTRVSHVDRSIIDFIDFCIDERVERFSRPDGNLHRSRYGRDVEDIALDFRRGYTQPNYNPKGGILVEIERIARTYNASLSGK
jgi:hypothetical protein